MTPRRCILIAAFAFSAILAGVIPASAQTTAADYIKLGNQHFNNAEWDQAIASFQTALKLAPTDTDAQLLLSLCYLLDGKPDLARAGAIKYESMKPNDPGGYVAQSQAASALNMYAEAVQAAQTAIRLKPDTSNLAAAYFQLGYNQYMLGKTQEANQAYQTLKTIDTDSAQSLYKAIQRLEAEKKSKAAAPPASPAPVTTSVSAPPAAPATKLPDLPDLPAARTAIQAANILGVDDLTLTDVIFILQYRDLSVTNQNAAKKVWSEVLAKEKDGQPLQISNALVISSTKTAVELALSDDCKHSKTADTHLVLAKPLAAPVRAGLVTNISGEITSYKVNPIMLTIERGQLLTTAAASTKPAPAASAHTTQPKPAPAAIPATAAAAPAPSSPADTWILYANPNGNFASRMPGQPKDTINPTGSDQVSHTLQASADGNAYTVVYVYNQSEQTVDAATYTVFRDNFVKGMPTCQMITEGDPSPVVRGYVGHSYRLNCVFSGAKVTIIGDLYWGRHFAYAVMAIFPTATFDPPFAKTFVDSFALVDPSK